MILVSLFLNDGNLFTVGGTPIALVQKSLALSTRGQYLRNAPANLLCDSNCDFTLTALFIAIALLQNIHLSFDKLENEFGTIDFNCDFT